jgi:hypothetical protein
MGLGMKVAVLLALTRRGDLVVVHFHFDALLFQREADRVADVLQRIGRRNREVAAFDRGAVPHVATLVFLTGGPRGLFRLDLHEAAGHVDVPGHRVEDEKLGLGPEIRDVSQAR